MKGDYARMFEEEYRSFARSPAYATLFGDERPSGNVEGVHNGYFSIDKKNRWTETAENKQADRANAERAYNLIMREKEKLLSLDEPLRFIFSHSALREGWDNPNVFQICALREIGTERERRQTIGRGLRLCVNQQGERLRGFDVNTLTVIATESYEDFAENLQREIEEDTGIRFGVVEPHQFAQISVTADDGYAVALGLEESRALYDFLLAQGHIDGQGRIQDTLRRALRDETFTVPDRFLDQRPAIMAVLRKLTGRLDVKDANKRRTVRPRQAVLESAEFKALWDRIKHKTTYRVAFDNEQLLTDCIAALKDAPTIPRTRLQWRKADIAIGQAGVAAAEKEGAQTIVIDPGDIELPDLLTELQDRTGLTRRSIYRVLAASERLPDFRRNPQQFIENATRVIDQCKRRAIVDGIRYRRIGDESYYAQELFEQEELTGYLKNMLAAQKAVHDHVIYESNTEAEFADQLAVSMLSRGVARGERGV